jgi:tRNA threonylcarbamoyladenosine biosynthesis protein TsaE
MFEITLQTESVNDTRKMACGLAKGLSLPAVIALSGQLGAGKTQFVKGLGQGLGLDPQKICSATFVLIAEYGEEPRLVHIDAYRLGRPEELENIGFQELVEDPHTLVAIEWAEKIAPLLPPDHLSVHLEILDDHRRRITITAGEKGEKYTTVLDHLRRKFSDPDKS